MTDTSMDGAGRITVALQKVYIKDSSFEAPNSPEIFTGEWRPSVSLNIGTKHAALGDDNYEVVLSLTADVKQGDKTAFLVEVHQAGIFVLKGLNEQDLGQVVGTFCPQQLYPYAREVISDLSGKGGFPQLHLQPVNFDGLAAEARRRQEAQAAAGAGAEAPRTEG
jgi:preprotein translocase subunit SecB